MISAEGNVNPHLDTGAFSRVLAASTETVVRLLEDAVKDLQKKSNCTEMADTNIESDLIINGSLNQISQKFTLNERQDNAFKIAGSYLPGSLKRSLLQLGPGKQLRMLTSGEAGTGISRVVEALKYLALSWGRPDAISTVAPTGIGAVLIEGETAHSKLLIKSGSISR